MVGAGLWHHEPDGAGARVGDVGVGAYDERLQDVVPVQVAVAYEEPAVGGVVGVEGETQQPLLAAVPDAGLDVEEGRVEEGPGGMDANHAALFGNEEPGIAWRRGEHHGTVGGAKRLQGEGDRVGRVVAVARAARTGHERHGRKDQSEDRAVTHRHVALRRENPGPTSRTGRCVA